jgi:hypothetical protein
MLLISTMSQLTSKLLADASNPTMAFLGPSNHIYTVTSRDHHSLLASPCSHPQLDLRSSQHRAAHQVASKRPPSTQGSHNWPALLPQPYS